MNTILPAYGDFALPATVKILWELPLAAFADKH